MAHILVIDDEAHIREILTARMEALSHTVFTAATLQEGLLIIDQQALEYRKANHKKSAFLDEIGELLLAALGIQEVNENVAQSSSVSEEIAKNIGEVNQAASEIAEAGGQVNSSAEEMSGLAEQLRAMTNKFKTA